MAFASLNPASRLWRANGLNYVLFPQDLPVEQSMLADNSLSKRQAALTGASPQPWPTEAPVRPIPEKAVKPVAMERKASSAWQPLPLGAWPEQWRKQLAKSRKGRFAWTYMDLGSDLLQAKMSPKEGEEEGSERQLRSQCLRKLFVDLGHPAGTHTFWPIALPQRQEEGLIVNTECFWSGLSQLECRGVVIMGSAAAQAALGTRDLKPLSQLFKFGKLVWILWEAHVIAANPIAYSKVLAFLRRSLSNFIRI